MRIPFFYLFFYLFAIIANRYCTRCEKYSSKLDISRSFIIIFEGNLEYTFTRCEKYSSKLDISRSFIRIFVFQKQ